MRTKLTIAVVSLAGLLCLPGCAWLRSLEGPPIREYYIDADPVLAEGGEYYVDPIDSSVVWSQGGVQVKVKLMTDKVLDERFDPRYSPYTLTTVDVPGYDYTPPLWTTFEITVINRTRDRVEFDPTQVVLRTDEGRRFRNRQGVGTWYDPDEYYDYSYIKWSGEDGNTEYHESLDRNPIWERSEFKREKPVRKGSRYSGMLTFPPLPEGTTEITLDVNNFILAFDRFEVGFGNPTEFVDMDFVFTVDHGVREKVAASMGSTTE